VTPLAAVAAAAAIDALVVGIVGDPVSLDPHRATDLVSAAIVGNVCEPLVRYSADGARPEPALATAWATRDARRWTFTLREGVRFHDGASFDADAVLANLARIARVRSFPGAAERAGSHVVTITLDRPNAALLATLSQPFFAMQSPRELARGGSLPVGTGPFRLVAAVKETGVHLEAHRGYWRGAPRLGRLVFPRIADDRALFDGLVAGQIDVAPAVSHDYVDQLRVRDDVVLEARTGGNIAFLSLNNERPPLGDRRVRLAIAHAIDRAGLVTRILGGHGEPAKNPLPPALWGYGRRTPDLVHDRAVARRLLKEAGRAHGFSAALLVSEAPRPYNPDPLPLARSLAAALGEIGVAVRLDRAPSWGAFLERATRGDYDMAVMGWQADTPDPNDFLSVLLGSEFVGATNRSRYRSPAMDGLLKQGRRGDDPHERTASYLQAQALFRRDMPWIPLFHVSVFTVHRRSVRGLAIGPTGIQRYDRVWKTA
jgi:peptide/nickel transport system substrate-binding protein